MSVLFFLALLSTPPVFKLPDDVVPVKHTIELRIDPGEETFSGRAKIDVKLESKQSTIWLNGRDLTIAESSVVANGRTHAATTELAGGEFIGVTPSEPVGPGDATILLAYTAPLSATAVSGPNRKKVGDQWYVFTTFTPTDARRAFPCFDEPRFKTPWELSFHVPDGMDVFSNAPSLVRARSSKGRQIIQFQPTQSIAAEVVAFAVGPFEYFNGEPAGAKKTPVGIVVAKGQLEQAKEAALATEVVLPRLEKYTGIPYPWKKLDHIALPQGAFGAVENPGLITYQSRALLVPPATPEGVRRIQTHEIGHQWFGNLVTQADWTDVWLSEGFATWITSKLMDEEQPADRRRVSAVASRERIMAADSGPKTHPVRREMHDRKELDTVYDRFPYDKGAAILLMVESWIGEDRFQQGLRKYLRDHAMGNATTKDLESNLPPEATPVFDAMLNSTGVATVKMKCHDNRLSFERQGPGPVPICWKSDKVGACTTGGSIPVDSCPAWVFPNTNGAGYYRVVWTDDQLNALPLEELSGSERLTLAYDLRAQKSPHAILKKLAADPLPEVAAAAKPIQKADQ